MIDRHNTEEYHGFCCKCCSLHCHHAYISIIAVLYLKSSLSMITSRICVCWLCLLSNDHVNRIFDHPIGNRCVVYSWKWERGIMIKFVWYIIMPLGHFAYDVSLYISIPYWKALCLWWIAYQCKVVAIHYISCTSIISFINLPEIRYRTRMWN